MLSKIRIPGSLKARITLFMLVIFVASLWSLTLYASRMLRQDMQQQLSEQQLAVVSFIARAADAHLHERIQALTLLANSIGPEAMADSAGLQHLLDSQPLLPSLFSGGVLITRADGMAVAETPRALGRTGVNFIDRAAVAMAMKDGQTVVGTPVMDKRMAVPVIGIAAPIRDATGRSIGTLAGVIALRNADFLDQLTQSPYGKTGSYFLVARQERLIIAATKKERIMQPLPPRGTTAAIDRFIDGFEGSQVYINPQGIEVMGSARRMTAVDWGVAASISATEAFAPIHAMQQRVVTAALLLTVLAGALTWWMLRRELWPLLDTAQMLAHMSPTEVPAQPLPVARQDEIGTLIMGFNHLVGSLEAQKSALEKQLQLFSAFIDALPNPIFIKNAHTVFTACNTAYEEAFGIRREVFVGKTVLELDYLPLAAREAFQAADLALLSQGGQTSEEIEIAFADGIVRTALYQRRAFDLGGGQGSAMLGLIVDISERKRMEQDLKTSEERYRLLAENANDVIWTLDMQGRFTYVSPSVRKLLGYTSAEAMQQTLHESLMPQARLLIDEAIRGNAAAIRAGLPIPQFHAELEHTRKDGSPVWTEVTANGVLNAEGRYVGLLGITRDISERKQRDDYKHFYSHILEMLATGHGLATILQAIVQGIEALHPDKLCSILLLDEAGQRVQRCIAPSLPEAYNAALEGLEIGMGVGSCGTAAFTNERVVVEDIASHPYWADFKDLAAQAGLGACWSQPIRSGTHRVLGTFGIYHRGTYHPNATDIALIEQTARLASITIEKTLAEERLHESQAFAQAVLNSVTNEIVVIDQRGCIVGVNEAWRQFSVQNSSIPGQMAPHTELGANYLGACLTDQGHADTARSALEGIQAVLDGKLPSFHQEYSCHSPTEQRWFFMTVSPLAEGRLGAVIVHTNITERKQAEEQIRNLAYYDSLTRLPNRRMLDERLLQALASSQRTRQYGALMLLDLDNFKPLNDTHGHGVGDLLLIEVAARLVASIREVDTVARLGGDEFVVVLGGLSAHTHLAQPQAIAVAEKIRLALARPYHLKAPQPDAPARTIEHHCAASIGVTLWAGWGSASPQEILKQADDAMYQAKESGRNTIHFSPPGMFPPESAPLAGTP